MSFKRVILMGIAMLLLISFTTSAFAIENTTEETVASISATEQTEKNTVDIISTEKPTDTDHNHEEHSALTEKVTSDGPFYITLDKSPIMSGSNIEPDATLTVTSSQGTDTVTIDKQYLSKKGGSYTIPFNIGTFSTGDTLSVSFTSSNLKSLTGISDGVINKIFPVDTPTDLVLNNTDRGYLADDNTTWVSDIKLLGTHEAPLVFTMSPTGTDSVTFILKDEQGNPLPDKRIRISSPTGRRNKDYTSNSAGQIIVPLDTFDSGVYVHSLERDFSIVTEDDKNEYYVSQWLGGLRYTITLRDNTKVKDISKGMDTTINLNSEQTFLFDINKVLSLKLSNEEDTFTFDDLQLGSNKISLSEGTYNIESGTDYFTLTGDKNVSSAGIANINVKSKYFLKVASNTSSSNVCKEFEVINIPELSDTVFYADTQYGVIPGQSLMLKDIATGAVSTVSIEEGNYLTELNIFSGETTVSGEPDSRISPHTADMTNTLLIILGIIILALIIFLILYFKKIKPLSKKKGTKILSLFLVGVFTFTVVATSSRPVYAGFQGGKTYGESGNSAGASNRLQAWNNPTSDNEAAMVKMFLAVNTTDNINDSNPVWITESSSEELLAKPNKFWNDESAIYIPTDSINFDRASNGGIFAYHYNKQAGTHDIVTTFGRCYWDPSTIVAADEYYRRLLPVGWRDGKRIRIEEDGRYVEGGERLQDYFIKFCINAFSEQNLYLGDTTNHKSYGQHLADYSDELFKSQEEKDRVIGGYLEYLKNYNLCNSDKIAEYATAYAEGKLVLIAQTMVGLYLKDGENADTSTAYYATVSDLVYLYAWVKGAAMSDAEYESAIFGYPTGYTPGYSPCGNGCSSAKCNATKHMFFSVVMPLMNNYLHTLRPKSDSISGDNPFGGWGFIQLGEGEPPDTIYPGIFGEINYTVVDDNGGVIDTFTKSVAGFGLFNIGEHKLLDIYFDSNAMQIPAKFTHNGKTYTAESENPIPAELYVTDKDGSNVRYLNLDADINNRDEVITTSPDVNNKDVADVDTNGWSYNIATNFYDLKNQLHLYLSNDEESGLYYTGDPESTDHGNVKVVFNVTVTESKNPLNGTGKVPQWRIDKYFPDILTLFPQGTKRAVAVSSTVLGKDSFVSSIYPTYLFCNRARDVENYGAKFKLNSPDLTGTPFISKAQIEDTVDINKVKVRHDNPEAATTMWGDLLAYKDSSVDDLTLPAWLKQGNATYKHFSLGTSTGEEKTSGAERVVKDVKLDFSWEPAVKIKHQRTVRRSYGFGHRSTIEVLSFTNTPATYGITVTFNCYNMGSKAAKDFDSSRVADNGVTTFTKQSDKVLSIYGEVPMLFTDVLKNNSIKFVTTDKKIGIKPISYHSLVFSGTIEPSVTGSSVATDSRAVSKLNDMGIPSAQMIHKGSGTQSTYTINDGIITAKTYAIDVGTAYESYKNKWNSAEGYSATAINEDFLNDFSSASADGTERTLSDFKGIENLCIGDQEYGNITKDVIATAPSTTVEEYAITVRAGEITSVSKVAGKARDVDTKWETTYPELAKIIYDKMKLDREGVLSVFAYRDGDALDESTESKGAKKFSNLSNKMREGSDSIAEGEGWYSEDSTVLSLYVFTTVFSVPSLTFSNKVPISISGIESPQDFSQRYSEAYEGNLKLDLKLSRG